MHGLRQCIYTLTNILQALRRLRECRFGTHRTRFSFVGKHVLCTQLLGDVFDFLLARQHAVLL